ncbi:MAG: uncharacterized protein QG670_838 [Thermoproteota archaeon]|nr:uncharacterized protein [Thermoproteota archaeon]
MSKTLNLAQQQITQAFNTVKELESAVIAFSNGNESEAEASIQRLFSMEVEIDNLRRAVLTELMKGELSGKYGENLKGLVENLDKLADLVKDSARSVKILIGSKIPSEISEVYVSIAKDLRECTTVLRECIEMLGLDPLKAIELAVKVEVIEGRVDDSYLKAKSLFIKHSKQLDTAVLVELYNWLNFMEQAADMFIRTADQIRILAETEVNTT